ncbi:hypothetical protein Srufu_070540 [Streptomyces libani subsp. rufus]|nr:hypothetical protein Srufu_070540 [Streptomyces libani subsp. rufus]
MPCTTARRTFVATKVGARPDPARGSAWPAHAEGLGGAAIRGLPPDMQREADEELLDCAAAHPGLTLTGYGTLMAGACSRTDRPLPERYDHPGSVARLPVVGVSSVAQLDECLAALDLRLDAVQRARLDTA